ncbi:MAG TPA: hypothetical protein HPP97_11990 [Desulfuromonadales bacterium]|nr:hypothetical protein [Desulfuromonadales bacterium]
MRIEGNDQRLAAVTATQMQNSGTQQMLAAKNVQQQDAQKAGKENTVQSITGDKVSITVEIPKNTADALQKMGSISDFLNSTATNLRQTNEGLKETSRIVTDMKSSLDKIIKNYPPYSIQSQERIDELMNFSSLKKQILSLEFPTPPPPAYESVKHLWEDLFSGPEKTLQTPTLPKDAPDTHVAAAAKQLDVIGSQIGLIQETMSNAVMKG